LVVPAIVLYLFSLSLDVKLQLVLNPVAPSPITMFTMNYVNIFDWQLRDDIVGYLFGILLIFLFSNNRKQLHAMSFFLFIVLPFISSFVVLIMSTVLLAAGFSAIAWSFIGYGFYTASRFVGHLGGSKALYLSFAILFIFGLMVIVAQNPTVGINVISHGAHLAGFIFGSFLPFLLRFKAFEPK
jgi:hypothetical protein